MARTLVAVLALVTGGCGPAGGTVPVPPRPPDTAPPDLFHDSVMVADAAGRWSRAVVAVAFAPDAPAEVRTEAILGVQGRVVGGWPIAGEGYYLVRVPHGPTLEGVDAAIRALREYPGVWSAIRVSAPEGVRP